MELNTEVRLHDFNTGELNGTVRNAAPIFCKPQVFTGAYLAWQDAGATHTCLLERKASTMARGWTAVWRDVGYTSRATEVASALVEITGT